MGCIISLFVNNKLSSLHRNLIKNTSLNYYTFITWQILIYSANSNQLSLRVFKKHAHSEDGSIFQLLSYLNKYQNEISDSFNLLL